MERTNQKEQYLNSCKKSQRFLLLIVEAMILIAYFLIFVVEKAGQVQMIKGSLSNGKSDYISYSDNSWRVDENQINTDSKDGIELVRIPYSLPKGHYTINIQYSCDENQSAFPYAGDNNSDFVKGSAFVLDKNQHEASYMFSTTKYLSDFDVVINYSQHGSFIVSGVSIVTNNTSWKIGFLWLLLTFIVIDCLLIFIKLSKEYKIVISGVIGMSLFSCLPLFFTGIHPGHDIYFHLMRIEAIAAELHSGHFPVRIGSLWLGGYGYPASIYYGDILLYFPAILRLFGVGISTAYKIYIFVITLLTSASAVLFFDKMFKSWKVSLLVSLTYVTASYRLTDIFVRSAVGEYSVMIFFPIILYALWNIYCNENKGIRNNLKNGLILAIGMSGVITSHILTAEMIVVIMLMMVILTVKKTFTLDSIRTYIIAIINSLFLSAFFLVPFLDYYKNVHVQVTDAIDSTAKMIQTAGAPLHRLISFFHNPYGVTMQLTTGVILMGSLVIAIVLWLQHKVSKKVKVLIIITVFTLFMSTNKFPWNFLATRFQIFDLLTQVQFPWRYIMMSICAQTVLFGCLLTENFSQILIGVKRFKQLSIAIVGISLMMMYVFVGYYYKYAGCTLFYDTGNINTYDIGNGQEYLRTGTDVSLLTGQFHVSHGKLKLISRKGTDIDFSFDSENKESVIEIPILNYKGYEVVDDTGNKYSVFDGKNNIVAFKVPADFKGNLHIRFHSPWYWTMALFISAVSAIYTIISLKQ